jgi:hypothetical protein
MNCVATQPRRPERIVMRKRADTAARNTTSLLLCEFFAFKLLIRLAKIRIKG